MRLVSGVVPSLRPGDPGGAGDPGNCCGDKGDEGCAGPPSPL